MKVQFDDFLFDADARQLHGGGEEIHLSPKAIDLLRALVEERPRALSKAELHDRLWPDTFVSDTNLASLVKEVRDALHDDARQPRYIRTAQRFGYAFCGTVETGKAVAVAASEATERPALFWLIKDGKRLPLETGETVIGREVENGVRIDSPTVSRRHARLLVTADGATIEDLESKNGTFVGETRVAKPTVLEDGDQVRLGLVHMVFRAAPGTLSTTKTVR